MEVVFWSNEIAFFKESFILAVEIDVRLQTLRFYLELFSAGGQNS